MIAGRGGHRYPEFWQELSEYHFSRQALQLTSCRLRGTRPHNGISIRCCAQDVSTCRDRALADPGRYYADGVSKLLLACLDAPDELTFVELTRSTPANGSK